MLLLQVHIIIQQLSYLHVHSLVLDQRHPLTPFTDPGPTPSTDPGTRPRTSVDPGPRPSPDPGLLAGVAVFVIVLVLAAACILVVLLVVRR